MEVLPPHEPHQAVAQVFARYEDEEREDQHDARRPQRTEDRQRGRCERARAPRCSRPHEPGVRLTLVAFWDNLLPDLDGEVLRQLFDVADPGRQSLPFRRHGRLVGRQTARERGDLVPGYDADRTKQGEGEHHGG